MPLKIKIIEVQKLPSQTMPLYRLVHLYEGDYGDREDKVREDNANTDSDSHENNMTNIPH